MRIIISELSPVSRILGLIVRLPVPPSNGKLTFYRTISCALVDINSTKSKNIISVFRKLFFSKNVQKRIFKNLKLSRNIFDYIRNITRLPF